MLKRTFDIKYVAVTETCLSDSWTPAKWTTMFWVQVSEMLTVCETQSKNHDELSGLICHTHV